MNSKKIVKGILLGACAVAGAFLFALLFQYLWNWLMPAIFGLTVITYWQAVGLLVLSKIIFGGMKFKSRNKNCYPSHHNLSDEEKEKLKEHFKNKCGW
jgi:hypothetical protein